MNLNLKLLPGQYAVAQLPFNSPFPNWAAGDELLAITRTSDELSVVCEEKFVPEGTYRDNVAAVVDYLKRSQN